MRWKIVVCELLFWTLFVSGLYCLDRYFSDLMKAKHRSTPAICSPSPLRNMILIKR